MSDWTAHALELVANKKFKALLSLVQANTTKSDEKDGCAQDSPSLRACVEAMTQALQRSAANDAEQMVARAVDRSRSRSTGQPAFRSSEASMSLLASISTVLTEVYDLEAPLESITSSTIKLILTTVDFTLNLVSEYEPDAGMLALVHFAQSPKWPAQELLADMLANDNLDARAWLGIYCTAAPCLNDGQAAVAMLIAVVSSCSNSEDCRDAARSLLDLHCAAIRHREHQAGLLDSGRSGSEIQQFLIHVVDACVRVAQVKTCATRGIDHECEEYQDVQEVWDAALGFAMKGEGGSSAVSGGAARSSASTSQGSRGATGDKRPRKRARSSTEADDDEEESSTGKSKQNSASIPAASKKRRRASKAKKGKQDQADPARPQAPTKRILPRALTTLLADGNDSCWRLANCMLAAVHESIKASNGVVQTSTPASNGGASSGGAVEVGLEALMQPCEGPGDVVQAIKFLVSSLLSAHALRHTDQYRITCALLRRLQAPAAKRQLESFDDGREMQEGAPALAAAKDAVLQALQALMVEAVPPTRARKHRKHTALLAADLLEPVELVNFLQARLSCEPSEELREEFIEIIAGLLPFDPHGEKALLFGEDFSRVGESRAAQGAPGASQGRGVSDSSTPVAADLPKSSREQAVAYQNRSASIDLYPRLLALGGGRLLSEQQGQAVLQSIIFEHGQLDRAARVRRACLQVVDDCTATDVLDGAHGGSGLADLPAVQLDVSLAHLLEEMKDSSAVVRDGCASILTRIGFASVVAALCTREKLDPTARELRNCFLPAPMRTGLHPSHPRAAKFERVFSELRRLMQDLAVIARTPHSDKNVRDGCLRVLEEATAVSALIEAGPEALAHWHATSALEDRRMGDAADGQEEQPTGFEDDGGGHTIEVESTGRGFLAQIHKAIRAAAHHDSMQLGSDNPAELPGQLQLQVTQGASPSPPSPSGASASTPDEDASSAIAEVPLKVLSGLARLKLLGMPTAATVGAKLVPLVGQDLKPLLDAALVVAFCPQQE